MANKKKKREKLTTSKKVLWLCWTIFIVLIILTAFGIDMGYVTEVVGGLITTVVTGFYMWKAKTENKIKITLGMLDDLEHRENLSDITAMLEVLFRNE